MKQLCIYLSIYLNPAQRERKYHETGVHLLKHARVWIQRSDTAGVNSKNKLDYIITARVIILFLPLEIIAQDDVEDRKQIPCLTPNFHSNIFFFFTFQSFISFSFLQHPNCRSVIWLQDRVDLLLWMLSQSETGANLQGVIFKTSNWRPLFTVDLVGV